MHGLANKAIEAFVTETYGLPVWKQVASLAKLDDLHFEAMMLYRPEITPRIIDSAALVLNADRADLLQNLGIYLVSQSSGQSVRRLLRFGGVNFVDFLYSLDDLHDRALLAVSDLELPVLELREHTASQFSLTIRSPLAGYGHVFIGLLTAMADDYGALVMLEHGGRRAGVETIAIALLETAFAAGNQFTLGASI